MFITDTIDVINHTLAWSPYAQLPKLGEKFAGKETLTDEVITISQVGCVDYSVMVK